MKRLTTTGGVSLGDAFASSSSTYPRFSPARTLALRLITRLMAM